MMALRKVHIPAILGSRDEKMTETVNGGGRQGGRELLQYEL
jgi:hypothetical protein